MVEPNGHGIPRGPEASGKMERRHELAAFLRSRRERITPEDAGLPGGYRRRPAGLSPLPASVVTERFDVLAWNPAYEVLFPRMLQAPPEERNTLLYLFAGPECCSAVENRADQRAALVAQLRAAYGHHVGDPAWTGFIRRMEAASPEFAAMWATQDVANPHYLAKVFRHPLYPRLEMTSTSFAVQGMPGTRMVVYTPDNEATRAAVEELVADPGSSYDLGTSQPEGPHTATRPPRMTVSHQFPRSPREPAITDLQ